MQNNFWRRWG